LNSAPLGAEESGVTSKVIPLFYYKNVSKLFQKCDKND
jgi:hypothetical protein